ncbi:MAG: DUF2497 domain-containing protein [Alphaproteobacteria bacterium]|nr:DUF2497 domain-containing protein [Alphaproteobacteria bacterium]
MQTTETQSMEDLLEQIRRIVASETQLRDMDGGGHGPFDADEPLLLSAAMVFRGEDDLSPLPSHRPAPTLVPTTPKPGEDLFADPFVPRLSPREAATGASALKFDNLALVDPYDLNLGGSEPMAAPAEGGLGSPMESSRPRPLPREESLAMPADPFDLAQKVVPSPAPLDESYDFSIKIPGFIQEANLDWPANDSLLGANSAAPGPEGGRLDDQTAGKMESLLAPMVAERVRENFAKLDSSRAIPDPVTRGAIINDHARSQISVEELVLDCLKPAIKEWLDMNLNRIVELLVKDEISRVSPRRK